MQKKETITIVENADKRTFTVTHTKVDEISADSLLANHDSLRDAVDKVSLDIAQHPNKAKFVMDAMQEALKANMNNLQSIEASVARARLWAEIDKKEKERLSEIGRAHV